MTCTTYDRDTCLELSRIITAKEDEEFTINQGECNEPYEWSESYLLYYVPSNLFGTTFNCYVSNGVCRSVEAGYSIPWIFVKELNDD